MRRTLAPANRLDRAQRHERFWQDRKKKFLLGVSVLGALLQLLFIGNLSYLYGSVWKASERYHNFNVLFVDYDEGIVGQSVLAAYEQLKGPGFPTFFQHDKNRYPSPDDVVNAVKSTDYWAAFMANANASDDLALAFQGGNAAQTYDPSGATTYVWNEVRYPPISDEAIQGSFIELIAAIRLSFNKLNGSNAFETMNKQDPAAQNVLLNPIMASEINLMPTLQFAKLFYNTATMVMPILQQFFFLLILNGLSQKFQLYSKLPLHISGAVRGGLGVVYDLIAGLGMAGYIWAFRESWAVTGNQFVLTWMVLWLLMHIHFLLIDAATAFLPLPALPFFLLTWIILNITSSVSPHEINPSFYKWGYALPQNEAYTILTDIWSSGNVPQLYRAMPILFSWWVVGISLAIYGHMYRCHKAWKEEEELESLARSREKHILEGAGVGDTSGKEKQDEETTDRSVDQGSRDDAVMAQLSKTPSQALIEAAELYRASYGPQAAPPIGLWKTFVKPGE